MLLLLFKDLPEHVGSSHISLFLRHIHDLTVHFDGFDFRLDVQFQKLFQAFSHFDGGGLRGRAATQVSEPFRNLFRMLHLDNGDLFEFVLDRYTLDPYNLNVLPHVLDTDLDFPGYRLVQHFLQLRTGKSEAKRS